MTYTFHREPRSVQREGFEASKDREFFALFWDPRVGKTQPILDTFEYAYGLGRVTAMIVIGFPSDTHLVWGDEAPAVLSPPFFEKTRMVIWQPGKMQTGANQKALAALLAHPGPKLLTLNCEAIITATARSYLMKFLAKHKTLLVADEDWATHWSARTKRLLALGRHPNAVMRRLLTGTPVDEGPHNLYFPTTFLKPGALGFTSALAFRNRYTEYEEGYNHRTGTTFKTIKNYQNLDELRERVGRFSHRARREGSTKIYASRYFTMTDKQRKIYDKLRDEYLIELSHGDLPVEMALTRLARLQMISRNYFPPQRTGMACAGCDTTGYVGDEICMTCEGGGYVSGYTPMERIDERNPAAEALTAELELKRGPFLVWARHRQEVTDALDVARRVYPRVARYDGTVPAKERKAAYHAFRAGEIDGIVSTERSGLSRGHDCRRARVAIFYSNEYSLRVRRQSEDRTESVDDSDWTDVIDLVAADTRDLHVIEALRAKRSLAAAIVGDPITEWI